MQIFVSYSKDDGKDIADAIYHHYTKSGHSVFVSGAIQYGDPWMKRIEESIVRCDIFLVVVTRDALSSKYVEKEVLEAQRLNRRIIPCRHSQIDSGLVKWGLGRLQGPAFTDRPESLLRDLDPFIQNFEQQKQTGGYLSSTTNKSGSNEAIRYYNEGNTLLNLGKYVEAMDYYFKAQNADQSMITSAQRQIDRIIEINGLSQALRNIHGSDELGNIEEITKLNHEGERLEQEGKLEGALNCYNKAVMLSMAFDTSGMEYADTSSLNNRTSLMNKLAGISF
jgi:tetratricopeptide (TPR) repeat protein